jgi:hypothetical protein
VTPQERNSDTDPCTPMSPEHQRELARWLLGKSPEELSAWGMDDPENMQNLRRLAELPA